MSILLCCYLLHFYLWKGHKSASVWYALYTEGIQKNCKSDHIFKGDRVHLENDQLVECSPHLHLCCSLGVFCLDAHDSYMMTRVHLCVLASGGHGTESGDMLSEEIELAKVNSHTCTTTILTTHNTHTHTHTQTHKQTQIGKACVPLANPFPLVVFLELWSFDHWHWRWVTAGPHIGVCENLRLHLWPNFSEDLGLVMYYMHAGTSKGWLNTVFVLLEADIKSHHAKALCLTLWNPCLV